MIRLLRYLIFGDAHMHKYEVYKVLKMTYEREYGGYYKYINRCSVCGKMKNHSSTD